MARKSRVNPETPNAVNDAAKKAADIHEQVYGKPKDDTEELATEASAALGDDDSASGGDIQPVEAQDQTDSAADTAPPPSPPETPPAQVEDVTPSNPKPVAPTVDWEEKYKTLQGKYNAEVPRLNSEVRELRLAVQELNKAPPAAAPVAETAPLQESVVSEQDLVDYGDDLVDLIRRVARAEATEKTKSLTPEIQEIKGQVQESQQRQVTNTVYSKLDGEIQDWKGINKSPEFVSWLQDRDPYAGTVRQDLLGEAFANGDGDRVVAFFKGFLAEQRAVEPHVDVPAAQVAEPQVRLEDLAGPASGTNGAAPSTQPDTTPTWTRASIASFYKDVQIGKYKHNPARKSQIEASISAALQRGAVA